MFIFCLDVEFYRYPSWLISYHSKPSFLRELILTFQKCLQILPLNVKCSDIIYWFLLTFLFLLFNILFSSYMFSFSLLLLFPLFLVQQVPSCSFLCFLCLTGSYCESISVCLGCSFSICSPSNQCLSHLKLRCSQNCLEDLFFLL